MKGNKTVVVDAYNTVDIVSWLITVEHNWQEETDDRWLNPSEYHFMREILHESVHFWQAVGLPYLLNVSFDAYTDFQRVRASAFEQGKNNKPVPVDELELERNRQYFLCYQKIAERYDELSAADIIEGLARYWDLHLCGVEAALTRFMLEGKLKASDIKDAQKHYGPFYLADGKSYTDAAVRFAFDYEALYNRAYKFTLDKLGREAFILFPVLAFFALSSKEYSVWNFQRWVETYARTKPFAIPRGHFFPAWKTCFIKAFKWITKDLQDLLYSSLTVYRNLSNQLLDWSSKTPLIQKFGPMIGQGALDPYMLKYWQWMRELYPNIPDKDVELRLHPTFCFPGIPAYRRRLMKWFHPPVILFADGKTWVDKEKWQDETPNIVDQLVSFKGMLGAAMALSGEFDKNLLKVYCPHVSCPWNTTKLCWKVASFPVKSEDCIMLKLYRAVMNLTLPTDDEWSAEQITRCPIKDPFASLSM